MSFWIGVAIAIIIALIGVRIDLVITFIGLNVIISRLLDSALGYKSIKDTRIFKWFKSVTKR